MKPSPPGAGYTLDDQVGFLLRRASQRHLTIFSTHIRDLTPTQFAVLAKLSEKGALSQNALGRMTAMDAATIKGVVDRLGRRGLTTTARDPDDKRRTIVSLSQSARALYQKSIAPALCITDETLAPLTAHEKATFLSCLRKLV